MPKIDHSQFSRACYDARAQLRTKSCRVRFCVRSFPPPQSRSSRRRRRCRRRTRGSTYRQLDQLMDVFERVRAEYVDEVDDEKLIEGAINGMLASLDPHSSYLDARDFRAHAHANRRRIRRARPHRHDRGRRRQGDRADRRHARRARRHQGGRLYHAPRRRAASTACRSTRRSTRCAGCPARRSRSPSSATARRSRSK